MNPEQKKVLDEATKAVLSIDKASLTELKRFNSPPASIKTVFTALADLFGQKTDWNSVIKFVTKPDLINTLASYKTEEISPKIIKTLNPYVKAPNMTVEEVTKASKAASNIWKWILTVYTYGVATLGSDFDEPDPKSKTQNNKTKFVWKLEPEKEDPKAEHEELGNIIKSIKKDNIRELTLLIRPSNKILKVMEGLTTALGDPRSEWGQIKRLVSQTMKFRGQLITLSIKKLTKPTVVKIKSYTIAPDLDMNNLIQFGPAISGFMTYLQTVVTLWEKANGFIDPDDVPKLKIEPETEMKRFASVTLLSSTSSPKLRSKSKPFNSPKSKVGSHSPPNHENDPDGDVFAKTAALQEISDQDVLEFKRYHLVQKIIEGMCLMLQGVKEDWSGVYRFLSNPDKFIHAVKNFEIKDVPRDNFHKLRDIMKDPRLEKELVSELSPMIRMVVQWLDSLANYKGFQQEEEKHFRERPKLKYTNSNHIAELRALNNPTNKIKKVLEAVCILLGEKTDWNTARRVMSNPQKFLDSCNRLNIEDIPVVNIQRVKKYMSDPDTDPAKLSLFSMQTADMARWFRNVVAYWEYLYVYNKHDGDKILGHDPMMATEQDILNHMDEVDMNSTVEKVGITHREESKEDGTPREGKEGDEDQPKEADETHHSQKKDDNTPKVPKHEHKEFPKYDEEEYKALLKEKVDALEAATESFRGRVDQVAIDLVLEFQIIPQGVEKVFEMAAIMLNEDRSWDGIKNMLNNDFVHRIVNIKLEGVERHKIQGICLLMEAPEVNKESLVKASLVASETLKWAQAYAEAWKVLHRDYL